MAALGWLLNLGFAGSAVVAASISAAPAYRTFTPLSDDRTLTPKAESRTFTPLDDDRTVTP